MFASLDTVSVTSLDKSIVLLDVEELPPETELTILPRGMGDGSQRTRKQRKALKIRLKLEIHDPDMWRRKAVCTKLAAWAAPGGQLTISDRPWNTLAVVCDEPPVLPSALNWTQPVYVDLVARDFPYWRSSTATTVNSAAETAHQLTICPDGNAGDVPLEVQIRNNSVNTVNNLTITTGLSSFRFENLALASGALLEIREENGVPVMTAQGETRLHCRAPESSDRLLVRSGMDNPIAISADQAVEVSVSARGAYW